MNTLKEVESRLAKLESDWLRIAYQNVIRRVAGEIEVGKHSTTNIQQPTSNGLVLETRVW